MFSEKWLTTIVICVLLALMWMFIFAGGWTFINGADLSSWTAGTRAGLFFVWLVASGLSCLILLVCRHG